MKGHSPALLFAAGAVLASTLLLASCDKLPLWDTARWLATEEEPPHVYDWYAEETLTAGTDAAAGAYFGVTVASSGDWAIVGARAEDSYEGAVYFFKRGESGWVKTQRVQLPSPAANDCFGTSVAIDGDYAVVGANGSSEHVSYGGAAYIYQLVGSTWTYKVSLDFLGGEPHDDDQCGVSVAISGLYAVVGSAWDDATYTNQGSAYVFYYDSGFWTRQERITSSAPYSKADEFFGSSVSLSGDYVVAGAPYADVDAFANAGRAFVFSRRSGNRWGDTNANENSRLQSDDPSAEDNFGSSVCISGAHLIIGAPASTGYAMVFTREGSAWDAGVRLVQSGGATGGLFGASVSLYSDTEADAFQYAVVGANHDGTKGTNCGAAFFFERTDSDWTQIGDVRTSADAQADDNYGISVFVSGNDAFIGAYGVDSDSLADAGAVYRFERY